MVHYISLLIIPKEIYNSNNVDIYIMNIMAKYNENINDDSKLSLYDWYEIGGRWNNLFEDNIISIKKLSNFATENHVCPNVIIDKEMVYMNTYMDFLYSNTNQNIDCANDNVLPIHGLNVINEISWKKEYTNILELNMENYVAILDCHI